MTAGIGGSNAATELGRLDDMTGGLAEIGIDERGTRIERARALLRNGGFDALYLDASTNLDYFTGLTVHPSERLHGALILPAGDPVYVCPAFEEEKTRSMLTIDGDIRTWQEHEDPCALVVEILKGAGIAAGRIAVDEKTPFFIGEGLRAAGEGYRFASAEPVTAGCRMFKSGNEIALIQRAMDITLKVQKAAAAILEEGISTREVENFLADAHRRCGVDGGLTFAIVLFGEPTAYPHGVPWPQYLKRGDTVLIDVGARVRGYHSDITRTYVFGDPSLRQREIWDLERAAQAAAFEAARPGRPCQEVDRAARRVIEAAGFGPGYRMPGLVHRTGHGLGLDIHEHPYLVEGNTTALAAGMCISNEPMICIYGEFGVRHEDHFYMTEDGPRWFTEPAASVDEPFHGV